MTASHIFGVAFIAFSVIYMAVLFAITCRPSKKPPIVPKLPTIPQDCIDALKKRNKCPLKNTPKERENDKC